MGNPCPEMPKEFLGATWKVSEDFQRMTRRANTDVRRWTEGEIGWVQDRRAEGHGWEDIAARIGRMPDAVRLKMKRVGKSTHHYNDQHREAKHAMNERMLEAIKPGSVLDLFGGMESFYRGKVAEVVSNDIDERWAEAHDHQMDAFRLLTTLYAKNPGVGFDLVDLDPFGSAFECFDLAIRMARKGLVITLGELGHRRWRRLDFVRYAYGIEDMAQFTMDFIIERIQYIGIRLGKNLIPVEAIEFNPNIGRVVFRIERFVRTEQWEKKSPVLAKPPSSAQEFGTWFS